MKHLNFSIKLNSAEVLGPCCYNRFIITFSRLDKTLRFIKKFCIYNITAEVIIVTNMTPSYIVRFIDGNSYVIVFVADVLRSSVTFINKCWKIIDLLFDSGDFTIIPDNLNFYPRTNQSYLSYHSN